MIPQKLIAPNLPANVTLGGQGLDSMPAYRSEDNIYTTRWKLSLKERILIFLFGNLWLNMQGFSPPVRLSVEAPYQVVNTILPWKAETPLPDAVSSSHEGITRDIPVARNLADVEDDLLPEPEDEAERKKRTGEDDRGFFS